MPPPPNSPRGPQIGSRSGDAAFRRALGLFATGVTIVTLLDKTGRLCGFTANSFSSVSLDPPLVLVCVNYGARSYEHLRSRQAFTIHILDKHQEAVARAFAQPGRDRSRAAEWFVNDRGYPQLAHCHAALECRLFREYEGGDHAIIVGEVGRFRTGPDNGAPLLSYGGQLFSLERQPANAAQ